jgi:protease-4
MLFTILSALPISGCITVSIPFGGGREPLIETVVEGEQGPKILLLQFDGILSENDESGPFGLARRESIVARVREELSAASKDDQVRAVVLRINSPGGTVTASDVLYHELRHFHEQTRRPIVAQMMGVAASGGYYIAMAADEVRAHPTTITGSIGVLFAGLNFAGLLDRLGVADQTLVAGARKDTGSPLRAMKPEERAQLQGVLDELHARFREVVAAGRPALSAADIERLADGRIYTAGQAKSAGLVDEIGYLPDAIHSAARHAGLEKWRVITYDRPSRVRENLYSSSVVGAPVATGSAVLKLELPDELRPAFSAPGFLYLWAPGARSVQ